MKCKSRRNNNIFHRGKNPKDASRSKASAAQKDIRPSCEGNPRFPAPKGISPLLASVLLIAVTVAIATLVAGWLSTTVRTTQTTVSNRTLEATECSGASITIEEVYIDAGANATQRAIIRNSGQADNLQIVSAQMYNTTGGNFSARSLPITNFNRGNVTTLSIEQNSSTQVMITSCPADFSRIIISTNCGGVSAEFTGTPKCF